MAKKKKDNPGDNQVDTVWDEAGLENLTREKLLEVAKEFELSFTENATEEEIIKAILEAQEEDTNSSQGDSDSSQEDTNSSQEDSDSSQEDTDKPDNTPPADTSGQGAAPEGKIRIKNENCKNGKRFLGNGELAEFDANGIAEIEATQAERLLRIPGYEKA
jgi:hypothetical protein